jgi:hypothetical protein
MSPLTAYGNTVLVTVFFKDQTAHTSGDVVSITQAAFTFQIALVPIFVLYLLMLVSCLFLSKDHHF